MSRKLLGSIMAFALIPALIGAAGPVSSGLVLNKDKIVVVNVPVGREINIDLPDMCIKPEKKVSCFFSLKDNMRKGYSKFPENLFAGSKNKNIVRIPEEQKYYNRHFEATLTARAEGPIATEIAVPVWIETESKVFDSTENLEKGFGFMPSAFDVNDVTKKEIFIYNNTGSSRTFNVFLIYPPQRSGSSLFVQSPGYEWLKEGPGFEISMEIGKKVATNRFKIELSNGQIAGIKVSKSESVLPGQEVLIAAVPEGTSGYEFARILRLKGKS